MGLLLVLFTVFLSACSGLRFQSNLSSTAPTPTIYSVFTLDDRARSSQVTPGMPAVSDLFFLPSPEVSPSVQVTPDLSLSHTGSSTPARETVNPFIRVTLTPASGLSEGANLRSVTSTPGPASNPSSENQASTNQPNQDILTGATQFELQNIYQDILSPGWGTQNSWGVEYELDQKDFVHQGRYGVSVTPIEDYAGMFFNREKGYSDAVLREDVAGVSFWINSGESIIYPEELAITVIGSNQYPYFVKEDTSVQIDYKDQFFSETRLSLLDFNTKSQPDTWYQVILWLDELPYDPDYKYITGFYIKNDAGFNQTYYIDDLSLIRYAD